MPAIFGMGLQEMLIVGIMLGMIVGVPIIIIAVVVVSLSYRQVGHNPAKPCAKCGMLAPEHGFCPHCGGPVDAA